MPMIVRDIGPADDVAAIRAQLDGWMQAYQAGDARAIMAFYAPGDEVVTYDIMAPLEYSGRASYSRSWQKFFGAFDGPVGLVIRDLQVKCSGNVGFSHSLIRMTGSMKGKQTDMWLRETHCLRKIDGTWLLVHDHVSVPIDLDTGKACTTLTP